MTNSIVICFGTELISAGITGQYATILSTFRLTGCTQDFSISKKPISSGSTAKYIRNGSKTLSRIEIEMEDGMATPTSVPAETGQQNTTSGTQMTQAGSKQSTGSNAPVRAAAPTPLASYLP